MGCSLKREVKVLGGRTPINMKIEKRQIFENSNYQSTKANWLVLLVNEMLAKANPGLVY